jgi:hypothetical protein
VLDRSGEVGPKGLRPEVARGGGAAGGPAVPLAPAPAPDEPIAGRGSGPAPGRGATPGRGGGACPVDSNARAALPPRCAAGGPAPGPRCPCGPKPRGEPGAGGPLGAAGRSGAGPGWAPADEGSTDAGTGPDDAGADSGGPPPSPPTRTATRPDSVLRDRTSMSAPHLRHFIRTALPATFSSAIWYLAWQLWQLNCITDGNCRRRGPHCHTASGLPHKTLQPSARHSTATRCRLIATRVSSSGAAASERSHISSALFLKPAFW